jgi:hypothetical protein
VGVTILVGTRKGLFTRPPVNVYVDGVAMREAEGLATPIERTREVRVVAAVAGG